MRRKYSIIHLIIITSPIFILFPQANNPQLHTPVYENISIEDGLPENSITCILQDYLGYLWLGTQNGLVKYDGYSMKVFQPEANNPGSISNGTITTIYEDKNKNLWVGTWNGLNKFNHCDESFIRYNNNSDNMSSINSDLIQCIYEDLTGRFWVGTDEGLNLFDQKNEKFIRYYFQEKNTKLECTSASGEQNYYIKAIIQDPMSDDLFIGTAKKGLWKFNVKEKSLRKYEFIAGTDPHKKIGWIQKLYKARDGKIWMASLNTLTCLNPEKKTFKSYIEFPIIEQNPNPGLRDGTVIEDKNGIIWSGFKNGEMGVFCLDPLQESFEQYKILPVNQKLGYFNSVYSLLEDRTGIIWIGTWQNGLKKLDMRKNNFKFLNFNFENSSTKISQSDIYSITYDPKGFIWYCTNDGLVKYNLESASYKYFLKNEKLISQSPYSAIIDNSGYIWLGVSYSGLIRFDPNSGHYKYYLTNPNESNNLVNKNISFLYQDISGFLWIATEGFGLYKYSIIENKLTHYIHNPDNPYSLSQNQLRSIFEDHSGTLWVGTNLGGLNKYNREKDNFIHYRFSCVLSIYEDKQNNFWIGDYFTGLNLFDREKGITLGSYSKNYGFQSNAIYGMLEDAHNNLWLGTENGLTKFNTITKKIKHYHKEDGLPDDWFDFSSRFSIGQDGRMYFNTRNGLVIFHPDSIIDDPTPPQVVLSGLSLFNRRDEILNSEDFISELKEITLSYNENDLRFDFVGLHFCEPSKNTYKYMLENFDKDWVDAGNQRNATYTNLDPGEYIFRVIAANKDGVWNTEGTSIGIIIKPPWWQTSFAYMLYIILIISIIYFTWKLQLKRIRIKHEYEMSKFEADKMHQIDEIKSRFFTNISHEFRTPLTLILGPVKQIIEKIKDERIKEELRVVHRNAGSLLGLVNQLLDISKIESGNMKLKAALINIVPLLRSFALSFTSYAERKRIALKFNASREEILAFVDTEKIERIITNLLSNAFKFTPEGGSITVEVKIKNSQPPNFAEISVSDTGIGIPKEKITKIFDRFYQVDGSHMREHEGTGIGLALTKELVDLHRGTIRVESIEGKGTTFKIYIPLGKDHLKTEEIILIDKVERASDFSFFEEKYADKVKTDYTDLYLISEKDKKVLLIVEDNPDVRNYIKDNLKAEYKIIEAADGEDGWNKSSTHIPDLIISDLMMPKMDGVELCKRIKSDERTSHIPLILLTAKATVQDKIEGYKTGADDYIMKPFEPEVLIARVRNLVEQRERVHDHFRKHGIIELDESEIVDVDKKFLQKAFNIITENISNALFTVEALADRLGVHRVVLHKKIVSLTGEPPVELIRRIRLKKAVELIEKKFGNISEIAYEVGFNNPAYFSECFKKQFGVSPSRYIQKMKNH